MIKYEKQSIEPELEIFRKLIEFSRSHLPDLTITNQLPKMIYN
jgi:hypothetical protein